MRRSGRPISRASARRSSMIAAAMGAWSPHTTRRDVLKVGLAATGHAPRSRRGRPWRRSATPVRLAGRRSHRGGARLAGARLAQRRQRLDPSQDRGRAVRARVPARLPGRRRVRRRAARLRGDDLPDDGLRLQLLRREGGRVPQVEDHARADWKRWRASPPDSPRPACRPPSTRSSAGTPTWR